MNELQKKDLKYIWHPCSQMKDYEEFPPIVIERGKGVYLYDTEGNSYIDAVSSWWVNLFGHSNDRVNKAIANQVESLEHAIFANFSHKPAIELAERIVKATPEGLDKVFFADNGSSAVEVALKLSFQYHQQVGNKKKTKFIGIRDAYHGETIGALSVSDCDLYKKVFNPIMLDTIKVEGPNCFRCRYGLNRDTCNAECFEHMEKSLEENHDIIAGAIIEPLVQCAAGMRIYSPVYLKKLREACTKYDIHFIADEIAVGFGRTGKMFACEHAEVSPDIMCVSKGLTAGYLPLSLTLMSNKIYDAFYDEYNTLKAFLHSHSYTGNPIGCAVACETLNIFEDENIIENNIPKSQMIRKYAEKYLFDLPWFGEFRQIGMIGAVELVEDRNKEDKIGFDWEERVGYKIYKIALEKGVLLRPLGNVIYFMPPYVINEEEIEKVMRVARESILEYFDTREENI